MCTKISNQPQTLLSLHIAAESPSALVTWWQGLRTEFFISYPWGPACCIRQPFWGPDRPCGTASAGMFVWRLICFCLTSKQLFENVCSRALPHKGVSRVLSEAFGLPLSLTQKCAPPHPCRTTPPTTCAFASADPGPLTCQNVLKTLWLS